MENKNFVLGIAVVAVVIIIGVIGFVAFRPKEESNNGTTTSTNTTNNTTNEVEEVEDSFTLEEIATHNKKTDCWMAIEGNVYDVTKFINQHPGGSYILDGCGKDATEMFNSRPESGTEHSNAARNDLKRYLIGNLE